MKFQTSQRSKPTVDSIRTIDGTDYRVTEVIGKDCHECGGAAPNGRSCRRCGATGGMLGKWIYEGEPVEQEEDVDQGSEDEADDERMVVECRVVMVDGDGEKTASGQIQAQSFVKKDYVDYIVPVFDNGDQGEKISSWKGAQKLSGRWV